MEEINYERDRSKRTRLIKIYLDHIAGYELLSAGLVGVLSFTIISGNYSSLIKEIYRWTVPPLGYCFVYDALSRIFTGKSLPDHLQKLFRKKGRIRNSKVSPFFLFLSPFFLI